MVGTTRIVLAVTVAFGGLLVRAQEASAQSNQQSICPVGFSHDASILRKTLRAAATAPNQPALDYARLSREQARPLNTPSDQEACARLDDVFRITSAEQRARPRSYFALGGHYVVLLPRDRKTRPQSEFGSVVFLDRDMKFVVAWTM